MRGSMFSLFALLCIGCVALRPEAMPALRLGRRGHTVRSAPALLAETASPPPQGSASLPSSTVNLVKAIVGSGVLSLPVGIAAFSSSKSALAPALVLMGVITAISGYCFTMVARVCEATGSQTWGEAWARSVGERSSWIPSTFVATLCFSASLQYTMVIGDSFSAIFTAAGLPAKLASRSGAIGLITALFTLPLCLLPSLEMLQYTSFLGIGGILYTAAFMVLRVPKYAPGSALHDAVAPALRPTFAAATTSFASAFGTMLRSTKTFVLVSILATAFCAHFLTPQFYNELSAGGGAANSQSPSSKLPRFSALTAAGFGLSALLSAIVMGAGFLTFGGASNGYILNNYATSDQLAQLARMAIGGSIVCTYPLLHQGLRDTLLEALKGRGIEASRVQVTLACIALVTALGVALTNLGTVAALSGALVSTSLVYTLPSIMLGQLLASKEARSASDQVELLGARVFTVLGIAMAAIGMKAAF